MKFELSLAGGKYTYQYDNGKQTALRYGEPWRDLCGDNLIGALAMELHGYRELCAGLEIPEDAQPGCIAHFVKSMRLIATQALSPDWTVEQAFTFMKEEAREALDRLKPIRRTASAVLTHCKEEDAQTFKDTLRELRDAVDGLKAGGNPIRIMDTALREAMVKADAILEGLPVSPEPEEEYVPSCGGCGDNGGGCSHCGNGGFGDED